MPRADMKVVWKYYRKVSSERASCTVCGRSISFKATTGNLRAHLKNQHKSVYLKIDEKIRRPNKDNDDEDSNSSAKVTSEIWGHFEVQGMEARCSLCQNTLENTVEEMKSHLEEEHPDVLISILKGKEDDSVADKDEFEPTGDTFTEVVYLDEEEKDVKPKRPKFVTLKREVKEKPKVPREVQAPEPKEQLRPEIDSFINYISFLIRDVPKESLPKLQLDVISLILNAQIAKTTILDVSNVNNGDYHITIENKNTSETNT